MGEGEGGRQVKSFLLLKIQEGAWRLQVHPLQDERERPRPFPANGGVGGVERHLPPKAKVLCGHIPWLPPLGQQEAGWRGSEAAGRVPPARCQRPPTPACVPAGQGLSAAGAPGAERECLVRIPISCRSVWIS